MIYFKAGRQNWALVFFALFLFLLVLLVSLWFYGYIRSFPLIGEDGAANYVFVVHAITQVAPWHFLFGIKWFEGLGQPNLAYGPETDPFNWIFFLNVSAADAFRISFALRAAGCWLATYFLVKKLLPERRDVAIASAFLNFLLCFPLGVRGGIPSWASALHLTQLVLLPLLICAYFDVAKSQRVINWRDLLLLLALALFLFNYPINSLMGLAIVFGFGFCLAVTAPPDARKWAALALAKLAIVTSVLLFAPGAGLFWSWSALVNVSARVVFQDELQNFGGGYVLPNFWSAVLQPVLWIVFLAVMTILLRRKLEWATKAMLLTLAVVVIGLQCVTLLRAYDVAPKFFGPLPSASRIEYYLTVFYAFAAAYALCHWREILSPFGRSRPHLVVGWVLIAISAWVLFGQTDAAIVAAVAAVIIAISTRSKWLDRGQVYQQMPWVRRVGAGLDAIVLSAAVVFLLYQSFGIWLRSPGEIYHPFTAELFCKDRGRFWCRDAEGQTVNAAANDLTRFLRDNLSEATFRGRAEFLVNSDPNAPLAARSNHLDMVRERTANFLEGKNGLLLSSLPMQEIPVASSYEQSLDMLYYLLWTRYVNFGADGIVGVNFTTLTRVDVDALALIGVRYVIVRPVSFRPDPQLPLVFEWRGLRVYEVPRPNTAGFAVSRIIGTNDLTEELEVMRSANFDPRRLATVERSEMQNEEKFVELSPVSEAKIVTNAQSLVFQAKSDGGRSFVILPFRYSHCLKPFWKRGSGRVVRADAALIGVLFEKAVELELRWTGGYFGGTQCLRQDASLVPEAGSAAKAFPYGLKPQ